MKASIVVPTRGGAARLPILFAALRQQDEKDFEVIVVLDGDVDSSRSVCEAEQTRGDLAIRVIEFPENRGRVAALNAGFEAAQGGVYIRCDDDFEPHSNYVSRHVELHEDGPRGVIGLAQNVFRGTSAFSESYGAAAEERFYRDAYQEPEAGRWRYWAGNVSVDADTYTLIGPYDVEYRAYGWEDVDWGWRLHEAGIPIVIDEALTTPHHLAAVTTLSRARRGYQSGSAMLTFDRKHPGALGPNGVPWTAWLIGVRAVALMPPKITFQIAGRLDAALPKLPAFLRARLVALVVEGSVLGGRYRPHYNDTSI